MDQFGLNISTTLKGLRWVGLSSTNGRVNKQPNLERVGRVIGAWAKFDSPLYVHLRKVIIGTWKIVTIISCLGEKTKTKALSTTLLAQNSACNISLVANMDI